MGKERDQHADRGNSFQLKACPISRHSLRKTQDSEATMRKPYSLVPSAPTQLERKIGTFQVCQAALISLCPGAMSTINREVCQLHALVRITGTNRPHDRWEESLKPGFLKHFQLSPEGAGRGLTPPPAREHLRQRGYHQA